MPQFEPESPLNVVGEILSTAPGNEQWGRSSEPGVGRIERTMNGVRSMSIRSEYRLEGRLFLLVSILALVAWAAGTG